ncbi:MFS transporter [Kribbella sandramycini]|uniref:MFS family permease n=1 Tax=Kribbella sandramycini TaxID=60450 RepID=A0A841S667_9ACTN|nr:MFS family permease [Kribbella sandramycini]
MKYSTLLLLALVGRCGLGLTAGLSVLYLTQVIGLPVAAVGITLTAAAAVAVVGSIWLGHLADRLGAREVFAAMAGLQALATAGTLLVHDLAAYAVVALTLALADLGYRSAYGAVVFAVVEPAERLPIRAKARVASNVGFAGGAGLAGLALASGAPMAYRIGLIGSALLIAAAGLLTFRLPRVARVHSRAAGPWAVLRDRPFVSFVGLDGVLNIHNSMIKVGIPLWMVTRTDAPHWLVSVMLIVNSAVVIVFQVRLSRGTDHLAGAARAGRRSGLLLSLACVILACTTQTSAALTIALLLAATLFHVVGEILESASGWGISFALAPPGQVGQYQGAQAMGRGLGDLIGPVLITTVALPLGPLGWLLTAAFFALAALLIPVVLRPAQGAATHELAAARL